MVIRKYYGLILVSFLFFISLILNGVQLYLHFTYGIFSHREPDGLDMEYNDNTSFIDGAVNINVVNGKTPCDIYIVVDGEKSNIIHLEPDEDCELLEINLEENKYYEGTLVVNTDEAKFQRPISVSSVFKMEEVDTFIDDFMQRKVIKE